ncbi:MAG: sulfatase, partial [Verrucomicrobiae bacterium]|nr:sulfatase [Verrucomicrobiae bacterium]NNJ85945.1 sulfatase [Akkermansiaceae bacterium]
IALSLMITSVFAEKSKPNFLVVMLDDMAADALFDHRFPFLKTPHLDRLAREGAVFDNMMVTTSLCSPSRASILTGTYAHIHGVRNNSRKDPAPHLKQFPQVLQQSGYTTAMIGKWHMARHARPRPGFDYWFSFEGQGQYINPEINENGVEKKMTGYVTDILTDKTIGFLKENKDKPFCIQLWHKACHASFTPAPRHAMAFADAEIKEPASWSSDFSGLPRWIRRGMTYGVHYQRWVNSEGKPVPEKIPPTAWRPQDERRLNMLRCLLAVDEGLGRVMDTLEQQGRLDNTMIIFTADNGWFFGEHRRGDKRLAYEESMRIPFAIRYPPMLKGGSRVNGLLASIDIAPTILDLAKATIPKSMQGESFVPVLEGKSDGREVPFFYQYFQEKYAPGIPTMLAIRTSDWKYITFPHESAEQGNFGELYHLKNDPKELKNLIHSDKAATQLAKMKKMLDRAKLQYGYTEPPYQYKPPGKANR